MTRALAFLLVRSVRGRLVQALRRLRQPRYLIGFLIGGGWAAFWISSLFGGSLVGFDFFGEVQFGPPPEVFEALAGPLGQAVQLGIALLLAAGITVWWLLPFGKSALEFSESELHLLLPAPVPRRRLIQYGILRSQPGVLLGVSIVTFFSRPRGLAPALGMFAGVWIFMTIWDLHSKGRGLWLARLSELPPAAAWRRRLLLWAALLILWVSVIAGLNAVAIDVLSPPPGGSIDPPQDFAAAVDDDFRDRLVELVSLHATRAWTGLLGWALTPFLLLIVPVFAGFGSSSVAQLAAAWVVPLLLLVAHNEWVVRGQTTFEEAALAHARQRSREADPSASLWRSSQLRRRWRPFKLASRGSPERAIVWKNLMLAQRLPFKFLVAAGALVIALLIATVPSGILPARWAGVLQIGGAALMLFPPLFSTRSLRNDLRSDLLKLEMIRPWPLRGARMFLAQVTAPFVLVALRVAFGGLLLIGVDSALELGLIDFSASRELAEALEISNLRGKAELASSLGVSPLLLTPLAVLGVLPLSLAVALLSLGLENLAALTFPGWVPLGRNKKQAASQLGHNLLLFMALSIALFFGLLPGVLVVGGTLLAQLWFWEIPLSAWEFPLLGIAGAAPVVAVVVALAGVGGSLWDRLDPSEEILAGSL